MQHAELTVRYSKIQPYVGLLCTYGLTHKWRQCAAILQNGTALPPNVSITSNVSPSCQFVIQRYFTYPWNILISCIHTSDSFWHRPLLSTLDWIWEWYDRLQILLSRHRVTNMCNTSHYSPWSFNIICYILFLQLLNIKLIADSSVNTADHVGSGSRVVSSTDCDFTGVTIMSSRSVFEPRLWQLPYLFTYQLQMSWENGFSLTTWFSYSNKYGQFMVWTCMLSKSMVLIMIVCRLNDCSSSSSTLKMETTELYPT